MILKGDSGASNHYIKDNAKSTLANITPIIGPKVHLPDGNTIHTTHKGNLLISLPSKATQSYVLPSLSSANLLSLGQLCDANCTITLTKQHMHVWDYKKKLILIGIRNENDGLWDVPLPQDPTTLFQQFNNSINQNTTDKQHSANIIIRKDKTSSDLIRYLHATCFSPTTQTFLQAIRNGNFTTWPGLTPQLVKKYLPLTTATAKGHLDQERKNLQTTKTVQIKIEPGTAKSTSQHKNQLVPIKIEPGTATSTLHPNNQSTPLHPEDELWHDFFPKSETINQKTHECFAIILDPISKQDTAYFDLTGKFPYQSARGHQYLFVLYHYDSNSILIEPLKSRQSTEIQDAWRRIVLKLKHAGAAPKLYILDNEASTDMKSALNAEGSYQLAPPRNHRQNAAERAIRTFKNHFIAGLASLPPKFPIAQWDLLLHQAELTLNLLRTSRVNPSLSAYAYLFGSFDFNKTPMAPPGTQVVIHEKPKQRTSWGYHGLDAWYTGPSLEHYRCIKCYVPSTRKQRVTDTAAFIPTVIPIPELRTKDMLKQAALDIVHLLNNPVAIQQMELHTGHPTFVAIQKIAELLNTADPFPTPPTFQQPALPPRVVHTPPVTIQHQLPPSPRVEPVIEPPPSSSNFSKPRPVPVLQSKILPSLPLTVPAIEKIIRQIQDKYANKEPEPRQPFRPRTRQQLRNFRSRSTDYLLAQHLFQFSHKSVNHIYNTAGKRMSMDALSHEIGRRLNC